MSDPEARVNETVQDWLDLVESHTPAAHAAGWDHVGLQVGDPSWLVARVLVSLDVTSAVIEEAAQVAGTLVLAHHPLLFRPLPALTPSTPTGKIALAAAVSRVAVAAAHTNLDVATDGTGTSDPAARVLGLADTRPLVVDPSSGDVPRGFGVIGTLPSPTSLAEVAAMLRVGLPSPDLRFAGDPTRLVEHVAIVGGAGDGHITDAIAAGADVYITGDLRHHVTLDALEMGLAVIDAGHHGTEHPAIDRWRSHLAALAATAGLTAPLVASSVPTSPWVTGGP